MYLFKKIAAYATAKPTYPAIVSPAGTVTYQELWNAVASLSTAIQSLSPAVLAIGAERTVDNVILVLATQLAGKAYLPIAHDSPETRVTQMKATAGVVDFLYLETPQHLPAWWGLFEQRKLSIAANATGFTSHQFSGSIPAYILFTSGSTGVPKGVELPRQALDNLVQFIHQQDGNDSFSSILLAPLTFDVSYQEIASTLVGGGTLHCVPDDVRLNPFELLQYVQQQQIQRLYLPNVSLHYLVDAAASSGVYPASIRQIITAGEQLKISPQIQKFFEVLSAAVLINDYGPTEAHVVTRYALPTQVATWLMLPSIGSPIANVALFLLDENGQQIHGDGQGELYISGQCLANGYCGNAALTTERFVQITIHQDTVRAYKTGDLVERKDGLFYFIARNDFQVKVRGNRVELGEIEAQIGQLAGVQQVAVNLFTQEHLQFLVAFVQTNQSISKEYILQSLQNVLPGYMVPDAIEWVNSFPTTASGKIDKNRLYYTPPSSSTSASFATETQTKLAAIWQQLLQTEVNHPEQHFFKSGGNSLKAIQLLTAIQKIFQKILPITSLFQRPKLAEMADLIEGKLQNTATPDLTQTKKTVSKKVAVIGMIGKFPGANSIQEFWNMLVQGKEGITFFEADHSSKAAMQPFDGDMYVNAKGILSDADCFDADFFDISPALAEVMDPQHRQFVQVCYQLLHATQHLSHQYKMPIGVFAGTGNNTYYPNHVLPNRQALEAVGSFQAMLHNEKDYVATRVAYLLNLTGPAVSVYSACSTSLLAIAQAVESIRAGNCSVAIAGAASIQTPLDAGYIHTPGGVYSADGHTRSFSANASGTVFNDGVGAVLLKNYDDAIADGDTIYAVVAGIGVNNDGAVKASFMAPSSAGQAKAISTAMADAGVLPQQVSYIEAHGTATPIGDPIELEALQWAFHHAPVEHSVALGSVKSNIGHLTAASGVAAFIKTVLSIYHKTLPASLHATPEMDVLQQGVNRFKIQHATTQWNATEPRIAGVSNFGVGGTNVHLILAEHTSAVNERVSQTTEAANIVLPITAHSETALQRYMQSLSNYSYQQKHISALQNALLQTQHHPYRTILTGSSWEEIINDATQADVQQIAAGVLPLVFLIPGQGSQYVGMGQRVYGANALFKNAVDECATILQQYLPFDIRDGMFSGVAGQYNIDDTIVAQPAIFVISYANFAVLAAAGIHPQAVIGHSIGELLAAHIAGSLTLANALEIVAHRAKAMQATAEGVMVAVQDSEHNLLSYLSHHVHIAGINSTHQTVLAGDIAAMDTVLENLTNQGIKAKKLATKHAFHTPAMQPIVAYFEQQIKHVPAKAPQLVWISTKTGNTVQEAVTPQYWAQQIGSAVLFKQAMDTAMQLQPNAVFVDIGAYPVATNLAIQNTDNSVVSLGKHPHHFSIETLQRGVGKLWQMGYPVQWQGLLKLQRTEHKVHLPTYVFDAKKYWLPYHYPQNSTVSAEVVATSQPKVLEVANFSLLQQIVQTVSKVAGNTIDQKHYDTPFAFLGMDSLVLTQLAIVLKNQFKKPIKFRELSEHLNTIHALEKFLESSVTVSNQPSITVQSKPGLELSEADKAALAKPFGATARIEKKISAVTETQKSWIQDLITKYASKSAKSKAYAQQHRGHMADPRVVTGFKPLTKEMVYPLVMEKSIGCTLTDIDGNTYIDVLNGFGSNFMGYQHPLLKKALLQQIEHGYELGPQHILAGEVCELITTITGHHRAALCNTGSEAVLGAMRMARTYTGKNTIVAFSGSYHGINDEVIVRATKSGNAYPAASGILPEAVGNMLILDYGTEEALHEIVKHADDIAAVLVEPVQSRRPDFFPVKFLQALRSITKEHNIVLVFDEVISGFRFHTAGIQGMLGIQADIGTYGKVLGGGLPIGMIAGSKDLMDTLDGGFWQYGDDSVPEIGVTYFAGTFVRHPLVLATAKATLQFLIAEGEQSIKALNSKTNYLAQQLNHVAQKLKAPYTIVHFGSLWRIRIEDEIPYADLVCAYMRWRGIHISDSFPCFLTLAHTEQDIEAIIRAFTEGVTQMKQHGFYDDYTATPVKKLRLFAQTPPVEGARLRRDEEGNPGWYISHINGQFERVEESAEID